jgi:hypothetical protein
MLEALTALLKIALYAGLLSSSGAVFAEATLRPVPDELAQLTRLGRLGTALILLTSPLMVLVLILRLGGEFDDAVLVQCRATEGGVDDVRRAVQALRRPEHLPAQAVGDHHVVADRHAEHALRPAVGDDVAERGQGSSGQARHDGGEFLEARLAGHQDIEGGVAQQIERESQAVGRRAARAAGR